MLKLPRTNEVRCAAKDYSARRERAQAPGELLMSIADGRPLVTPSTPPEPEAIATALRKSEERFRRSSNPRPTPW